MEVSRKIMNSGIILKTFTHAGFLMTRPIRNLSHSINKHGSHQYFSHFQRKREKLQRKGR